MNKIDIEGIIYLGIVWYISGWIIAFLCYGENKKISKEKQEMNYKEFTNLRHIICAIILICMVISSFN